MFQFVAFINGSTYIAKRIAVGVYPRNKSYYFHRLAYHQYSGVFFELPGVYPQPEDGECEDAKENGESCIDGYRRPVTPV
jgi:hypothetical protein